jgi:hypothetical protein
VYQFPPASRFKWFETDRTSGIRVRDVSRLADLREIPLLLKLTVPDDYERRPWYQTVRPRFVVEPLAVHPTS